MEQFLGTNTWGIDFILWVQTFSHPLLDAFFKAITWLGSIYGYMVILPIIFWCIDRQTGQRLFFLVMFSEWVSTFLKNLFKVPRPDPTIVRQPLPETTFSFPSDHAQTGGVVFWGYLASRVRRTWFTILAVVMAFLLGASRIYLGVHHPQDVLAGWIVGLVILGVVLKLEPTLVRRWSQMSLRSQVAVIVIVPLLLLLLVPSDENGRYPGEMAGRLAGVVIGAGLGSLLELRTVRFRVDGPWWQRILRYIVGIALVLATYLIGSQIPELSPWGLDTAVRLIRYIVLGLVSFWIAPWVFTRLKLATSDLPR